MIETYNANRDTQIKDGKATVSFGFSVEGITQTDARHVEKEIDLFLARVAAPQRTSTTPKHFVMVPWSDAEKDVVRVAQSKEDAWTRYQAAFPNSSRGKSTVTRWWDQYHEVPKDTPPGGISGDLLTETEKEADRQAAKAREELPGKKPTARQIIKAKAKKPEPREKRGGAHMENGKWSPDEIKAVAEIKDRETAVKAYRAAFPDSKRNDNAVGMKWYAIDRQAKKEAKQKKKDAKVQKTAENVVPPGPAVGQEYSVDTENGGTTFESMGTPDDKTLAEEAREALEAIAQPAPSPTPSDDGSFRIGDTVRHTGHPVIFQGTGRIKRIPQGQPEVLVSFDNGMEWINRSNLAKVGA